MVTRARKAAKRTKAPKRAKRARNSQSTAVQSARPKPRKPKSGERQADEPKSETARLKNLLLAAEHRQTATADILKVIASSPSDVQPVFDAIVASANRLIGGYATAVFRFIDGYGHLAAFTPINPDADEKLKAVFPQRIADVPMLRPAQAGEVLQIDDTEKSHERLRDIARARGFRSILYVPLKSKETSIGVIATNRRTPGPFSAHDVRLLQTFADQAVIAIENTRLFNEVQAKTADLSESLQQQTATADVLKMISRSVFDLQPVLDGIARVASDLCAANDVTILIRDGDNLRITAHHGSIPMELGTVRPINRDWVSGRAVADRRPVHVRDLAAADDYPLGRQVAAKYGHRTTLAIPLLRNDETAGCILLRRLIVDDFTDEQIALLQTFADQAVIAIENVRLFNETKEALERQTATAEILKVIASSPSDVQPVFEAIAARSNRAGQWPVDCGVSSDRWLDAPDGIYTRQSYGRCRAAGGVSRTDDRDRHGRDPRGQDVQ
jgi:GAF domain-containing protein